uniref:Putative_PNPOx domain-containing protein n=1 Tax=Panagrellus redivivus TaxID=6233 RepID=A0A7E4VXH4_PANRE
MSQDDGYNSYQPPTSELANNEDYSESDSFPDCNDAIEGERNTKNLFAYTRTTHQIIDRSCKLHGFEKVYPLSAVDLNSGTETKSNKLNNVTSNNRVIVIAQTWAHKTLNNNLYLRLQRNGYNLTYIYAHDIHQAFRMETHSSEATNDKEIQPKVLTSLFMKMKDRLRIYYYKPIYPVASFKELKTNFPVTSSDVTIVDDGAFDDNWHIEIPTDGTFLLIDPDGQSRLIECLELKDPIKRFLQHKLIDELFPPLNGDVQRNATDYTEKKKLTQGSTNPIA